MRGRKSWRPICRACCSIWRNGARPIPASSRSSIRRRRGALTEARALLAELGAIDAQGRITDEGRKLRQLPLPPRLARMVVDAAAEGAGQRAADIAAILSERGLGGNDVDLGHRLDQFRRDRSRRGEDARRMAKRWADDAGAAVAAGAESLAPARSWRSPIRTASPRAAAPNGAFLLANGRGANVDPASALAREPFLAVAELAGTAAQSRILLAAPITLDEIEAALCRPASNAARTSPSMPASASLRGRRSERLGAIALAERPFAVDAGTGGGEEACRRHRRGSASTGCRGPNRCSNGATA